MSNAEKIKKHNSVDDVINDLPNRFQADTTLGVDAFYHWNITGEGGREFTVKIHNGTFEVLDGKVDNPDVSMELTAENYLKMVNGELKGIVAIMTRKLKVRGNFVLAQKYDKFFE